MIVEFSADRFGFEYVPIIVGTGFVPILLFALGRESGYRPTYVGFQEQPQKNTRKRESTVVDILLSLASSNNPIQGSSIGFGASSFKSQLRKGCHNHIKHQNFPRSKLPLRPLSNKDQIPLLYNKML